MRIEDYRASEHFWGKLSPRDSPTEWHPLADHCIDVACCARALLACQGSRRRLAALAGVDDLDPVQCDRLAYIAGLHDLGKFNTSFQGRITGGGRGGHASEATWLFTDAESGLAQQLHAILGLARMESWFARPDQLDAAMLAVFAHHGEPVAPVDPSARRQWQDSGGIRPLDGCRQLIDALDACFPDAHDGSSNPLDADGTFQQAFSGLVMLADWLGSDVSVFHYSQPGDGPRCHSSRERAEELVAQVGLNAEVLRTAVRSNGLEPSDVLGFPVPRPVQGMVAALPLPELNRSSLVILEAATGSGKTEAAWLWFARLVSAGAVDGLYMALPTRSAATQLHERLKRLRERWGGDELPAVIQAVPGYLKADGVTGTRSPLSHFEVLWDDADDARRWRYWAAESAKRYMAAGIAVGTIDQALLSIVRVKHAHMRAFGLMRQLLVVDEVHASDPYMDRILREVLSRHLAAGGHALLMSATLGSSLRRHLEALATNDLEAESLSEASQRAYPLASYAFGHDRGERRPADAAPVLRKHVAVDGSLRADDTAGVVVLALHAAQQGARVLVIRNTVGACIATHDALVEAASGADEGLLFRCGGVAAPHHSRFAPEDRTRLDTEVEKRFGKKDRPSAGCVLVATQTVEQSLDIDADVLLTDLCPIDVLLQRIGRLHRHERTDRPAGFEQARCRVLTPSESFDDLVERRSGPHGWGTVYPDLRMLHATQDLVEQRPHWTLPDDNRSLVEGGTHDEVLSRYGTTPTWQEHQLGLEGGRLARLQVAQSALLKWRAAFGDRDLGPFPRGSDEAIRTRLGDEDRLVPLPTDLATPFGNTIRSLRVPGWLVPGLPREPSVEVLSRDPIRVSVGEFTLEYSSNGLFVKP